MASAESPEVPELALKDMSEAELFENLINQGWTAEEQTNITAAYDLARGLHADDTHRDHPYVFHLLRVANRIASYLEVHDAELIVAALLHDSVEDHAVTLTQAELFGERSPLSFIPLPEDPKDQQQVALQRIGEAFSGRTATIVEAVTNPPDLFEAETEEQGLENYRQKVKKAITTPEGAILKFADWCDNAVGIIYSEDLSPARIERFKNKYGGDLIDAFEQRFAQPDLHALLVPKALAYVGQQIALARERLDIPPAA